jgi:hypothetical protein
MSTCVVTVIIIVWINSVRSGHMDWRAIFLLNSCCCCCCCYIIIIITECMYDNISEWKVPWQIVHNWNFHATFTVQCSSICGNMYCTPQYHAPHKRLSVMCDIWGSVSGHLITSHTLRWKCTTAICILNHLQCMQSIVTGFYTEHNYSNATKNINLHWDNTA